MRQGGASRGRRRALLAALSVASAAALVAAVPGAGPVTEIEGVAVPLPAGAPGGDARAWAALVAGVLAPSPPG
jgi:hypothetical protein